MTTHRLRHKLLLIVGIALAAIFSGIAYFYTHNQEQAIIREHERSIHTMTSSVISGIESLMLESHTSIMKEYAARLKQLPDIKEFSIMRRDGQEAFQDGSTVAAVNERLGEHAFDSSGTRRKSEVMASDDPRLVEVLSSNQPLAYETTDKSGLRYHVFMDPIPNKETCHRCHTGEHATRGVIRVVSSLAAVEADILRVRLQSLVLIGLSLVLTTLVTGYMLGRSIVKPIELVTGAMARISAGDFDLKVPLRGGGEILRMAENFNAMTTRIKDGYALMNSERDKLATVIHGAREAVVVTDSTGQIVLVNPAACELIGKDEETIRQDGFTQLLDDPDLIARLVNGQGADANSEIVNRRGRYLKVTVAEIDDEHNHLIGSSALIRDVTDERRLLEELRRISITDALTGVHNRRYLDERLKAEFERVERYGKPLSVLLFDVDHFKKFNDTYGHDQGDRVLQAIGKAMYAALRKYDIPCRYGGEEFVAILPETGAEGAISVGERLRTEIEAMVVDGLKVTISVGAATFPDLAVTTPEALLEAADAALYKSKENGRNRLTVATTSML